MQTVLPLRVFHLLCLLCCLFMATGCATKTADSVATSDEAILASLDDDAFEDYDDEFVPVISDPLEPWNRFWFSFNDTLMIHVLSPLYKGYKYVTPEELRLGLSNAYHNLKAPIRISNAILQGEFARAWIELGRFVVNSTLGFGGLLNITKDNKPLVPISHYDPDFDQTLAKWGVGEGFYIVWPFLGPNTARGSAGLVANWYSSPLSWISEPIGPVNMWVDYGITAGLIYNDMGPTIEVYEEFRSNTVEPYVAVRDAYVLSQRAKAADTKEMP